MKEKRNLHHGKPPKSPRDQLGQRDLKVTEKSAAAGLRTKQSENHTDHLHHSPEHHSLRCLGGGWARRLRLWRSVSGKGLGWPVWGQPEGLRSCVPQADKQCATGWWVEHHVRGKLREGLGPREKKDTSVGEGERRRSRPP